MRANVIVLALALAFVSACANSGKTATVPAPETEAAPAPTPVEQPSAADAPTANADGEGGVAADSPPTASDDTDPGDCVADCVGRNQMRAVSPEQIEQDCQRECADSANDVP